jgi:hypothetical protein
VMGHGILGRGIAVPLPVCIMAMVIVSLLFNEMRLLYYRYRQKAVCISHGQWSEVGKKVIGKSQH